jgi:hypothetical protein
MKTVARNRIEKVLPRVIGGAFFSLGNHFTGEAASADEAQAYIRKWTDHGLGKLQIDGTKGRYRLHSNEWLEIDLAE